MAKRKPKVDNRPWVNKEDIVVFDGTKETVDKIHDKAKKTGGYLKEARYSIAVKRFLELRIYLDDTEESSFEVSYMSALVFTGGYIMWFENEEKALAAVRVRTGYTRVTITFEHDDAVSEIVVPRTYSPMMTTVGAEDDYYEGGAQSFASKYSRMTIDLGQMVGSRDGVTHYIVDRVKNPDYVVPEFS